MYRNISIFLLVAANMGGAHGQGILDGVQRLFRPTKEFAGISLKSSIKDAKQVGLQCEESTDIVGGKAVRLVMCEDKAYRNEVFGVEFRSRQAMFINERLATVKVYKSTGWLDGFEYSTLKAKLDSVYAKTSNPKLAGVRNYSPDTDFWNFGDGYILLSGSNANCINCGAGIVVLTPAMSDLQKAN